MVMASRSTLSSNPDVLLEYMDNMPYESESDDDFDGYLEPDEGPVAYRRSQEIEEHSTPVRRTQSVNDLTSTGDLQSESPFPSSPSLSNSPMQQGSPLAAVTSPSHPRTMDDSTISSSTRCTQVSITHLYNNYYSRLEHS